MSIRPKDVQELQIREAAGVIRASRFVRKFARLRKDINLEIILQIHKLIFKDAWAEIAGQVRTENLEISDSKHRPPHYVKVRTLMEVFRIELQKRLQNLSSAEPFLIEGRQLNKKEVKEIDKIVETAAWLHHQITYIHPFREGNGRTARLAGNLILERYGLVGISIKVERENKNRYRDALAQIDQHEDYKPLKSLIYEGLVERYDGVVMKYIK